MYKTIERLITAPSLILSVTGHAMTTFQKQTDNNNYEHKTDTVKNNQRL